MEGEEETNDITVFSGSVLGNRLGVGVNTRTGLHLSSQHLYQLWSSSLRIWPGKLVLELHKFSLDGN